MLSYLCKSLDPPPCTARPWTNLQCHRPGLYSPSSFPELSLEGFTCHQFNLVISLLKTLNGPPLPTRSNPNLPVQKTYSPLAGLIPPLSRIIPTTPIHMPCCILLFRDSRNISYQCPFFIWCCLYLRCFLFLYLETPTIHHIQCHISYLR